MDDQNEYFLNGNRVIDWPGVYLAEGDAFSYNRSKDFESISTSGPLTKDVIVTVMTCTSAAQLEGLTLTALNFFSSSQHFLFQFELGYAGDTTLVTSAR